MKIREKLLVLLLFAAFGGIGLWMQFGIEEGTSERRFDGLERHDPDYYVENFTAVGMDKSGRRRYVLEAERLVHYPDDDTALLDKPHVIQYEDGKAPRHTYSDSGWMSSDGDEVLLTGNVRVIQGKDKTGAGGVLTTDKMKIRLKKKLGDRS